MSTKRFEGNVSGHITHTTAQMSFLKERFKAEERHQERYEEEGLNIPGSYKPPSNRVFPTPRIPLESDRGVKLFRDFAPPCLSSAAFPMNTSSRPGDEVASQRSQPTGRSTGTGRPSSVRSSQSHTARSQSSQRSVDTQYVSSLRYRKQAIEDEINALEAIIENREKKALEQIGPERPFANLPSTHRDSYASEKFK